MKNLRKISLLAGVVLAGVVATQAHAAPIALTGTYPDVFIDTGSISWNASTKIMTVTGTAEYVKTSSLAKTNITSGTFTLTAALKSLSGSGASEVFGPAATGSSFSVTAGATTYFSSANLLQFGFNNSPVTDNFQLIFSGGTGISAIAGQNIAIDLHGSGGTTESSTLALDSNFTENFLPTSTADVFNTPAPEPASIALLGLAAPLLLRRRRSV